MDLERYVHVAWRFKYLVSAGFVVACALAVLTVARVSLDHGPRLSYRTPPTYKSTAVLLITQQGFPWGRTVSAYIPGDQSTGQPSVPANDPVRLATLTGLYAQLATSDQVRSRLSPRQRRDGTVTVTAVPAPAYTSSGVLPLLSVAATAPTGREAAALATRATSAFQAWLLDEQNRGGVRPEERVEVDVVTAASRPVIASKPKKTTGAVVFLAIMAAVLGVAMVLENLRPRSRVDPGPVAEEAAPLDDEQPDDEPPEGASRGAPHLVA